MTLDHLSCEDAGGSTDETFLSYSRRLVDLVNRCVVSDEVYTALQANELALQEYLQRGTIGKYKDDALRVSPVMEMFKLVLSDEHRH